MDTQAFSWTIRAYLFGERDVLVLGEPAVLHAVLAVRLLEEADSGKVPARAAVGLVLARRDVVDRELGRQQRHGQTLNDDGLVIFVFARSALTAVAARAHRTHRRAHSSDVAVAGSDLGLEARDGAVHRHADREQCQQRHAVECVEETGLLQQATGSAHRRMARRGERGRGGVLGAVLQQRAAVAGRRCRGHDGLLAWAWWLEGESESEMRGGGKESKHS